MTSDDPTTSGADEREEPEFVAMLERFGTTLRGAAVWEAPPSDLGDRITSSIAALRGDAETPSPAPPASLDTARQRRARAWLRPALGIAAAAVVAFTAGVLIGGRDEGGDTAIGDVSLEATDVVPGAGAAGDVVADDAGYEFTLDIQGLPPAGEGSYYEGWVCNGECTTWVSIGTFHMRGGDGSVVLWSGVRVADYPRVVVTIEQEGDRERGDVVLEGAITRR